LTLIDVLRGGPAALRELARYLARPAHLREGELQPARVLVWSVLSAAVLTHFLHLGVDPTLFKLWQQDFDRRDAVHVVVVRDGAPAVEPLQARHAGSPRPVLLRVETLFYGGVEACEAEASQFDPGFVVFTLGLFKRTGFCFPASMGSQPPPVMAASDPAVLARPEVLARITPEVLQGIERHQRDYARWVVDEVAVGFGFTQLWFRQARLGDLGKNEPYLLVMLFAIASSLVLSLHGAARLLGSPAGIGRPLSLCLYGLSAVVVLLAAANAALSLAPGVLTRAGVQATQAAAFWAGVLVMLPAILALFRSYALSPARCAAAVPLGILLSLPVGLLWFAPIAAAATLFHETLQAVF
jgi:hypothetical protein